MAVTVSSVPIIAENVSVKLGETQALNSVSFNAQPGELVGLIGPNGAGKSTLLRVLAGLIKPDHGSVSLGDSLLDQMNAGERARSIAFMPQHDGTHPFTALETVLMGRYPHLGRFELEGRRDRNLAFKAMRRTDTVRFEARQLDKLSGGERQRVVLARALVQQAGVILLDEPSSSLDLRFRLSIMETLREEIDRRQVVVVVALHDISLASRYCDRLALLSEGLIDSVGSPKEVLTSDNLKRVFAVNAKVQTDPDTGCPQVWLIGPVP